MAGWYDIDGGRLGQDEFWPAETTIDLLVRDWAVAEGRFDWYLSGGSITDPSWMTVAYVSLYLPSWEWDGGFGSYAIALSLTCLISTMDIRDRVYLRLGTSGSGVSTTSTSGATVRVSGTFPFATAPTGKVDFPLQGYVVGGGGPESGNVSRPIGLLDGSGNLDTWAVMLT